MFRRRSLSLAPATAVAVLSLFAAGCGGGGSGAAPPATTAGSTGRVAAALSLAQCLRSHGIPNWPDPDSSGGFDKTKLRQLGAAAAARVRTLEDGPCNITIPDAGPPVQAITPADRGDYLRAAACMRSHGFANFPDPTFHGGSVSAVVPSTINQDSPRFKRAASTCTRLIPAGLPYSAHD